MKREPIYAKEGHIFQHKERADEFARILYLGEGVTIDDYQEITDEEYEQALISLLPPESEGVET